MTAEDINNLMDLIKEHIDQVEDQEQIKDAIKFLNNTKEAVKEKKVKDPRFAAINLS